MRSITQRLMPSWTRRSSRGARWRAPGFARSELPCSLISKRDSWEASTPKLLNCFAVVYQPSHAQAAGETCAEGTSCSALLQCSGILCRETGGCYKFCIPTSPKISRGLVAGSLVSLHRETRHCMLSLRVNCLEISQESINAIDEISPCADCDISHTACTCCNMMRTTAPGLGLCG